MIIIFNILGIIVFLLAGFLMLGISALITGDSLSDSGLSYLVGGGFALGVDLAYRLKGDGPKGEQLFYPREGGHVFFIPLWILGSLWILIGLTDILSSGSSVRSENDRLMQQTIDQLKSTTRKLLIISNQAEAEEVAEQVDACDAQMTRLLTVYRKCSESEQKRLDRQFSDALRRAIDRYETERERISEPRR